MRDVAFTGTIAPGTVWIRARESRISLWRWRRQCHNSPPMARNGLKDTGATPVSPRYYSPGLPFFTNLSNQNKTEREIYERLFIIVLEEDALKKSWINLHLGKAKEEAIYSAIPGE